MDLGLKGRRALITGGSRGIGLATARLLAEEGVGLVLVARSMAALEEAKAAIGGDVVIESRDLSDPAAIEALAQRYTDIDILVNNAGDMPSGDLFAVSDDAWRKGWEGKPFSYMRMCRAFYPAMKVRGRGVIVNLSGIGASLNRWDYLCSGMGNHAVEFLTRTLGGASVKDGIRVVGVSPGPVSTERQERVMANWFGDDAPQPDWPMGRRASAEELASMIAFLASDRSGYTSGSIHVVDGGVSISRVV